jgi:HK97 family phage portal protein
MSLLIKAVERAGDFATRSLNLSQSLVAKASDERSGIIAGFANAGGDSGPTARWENMSTAHAQYEHFRGLVHACVNTIAMRVAGQKVCVSSDRATPAGLKTTKAFGDDREPLDNHAILDLLAAPNGLMSGSELIYTTVASLELCGRSLWHLVQDADNTQMILPVPSSWIKQVVATRTSIVGFIIRLPNDTKDTEIPASEAVYVRYVSPSDPWGHVSPLSANADAVQCDAKISDTQYKVFQRGPWPTHAVVLGPQPSPPGSSGPALRPQLTPEQRKQIITAVTAAWSSTAAVGSPIVLDGMIDRVERLSLSASEMAFLESATLTKERILMGYAISEVSLGSVANANRASAAIADENFVANKINPLITMLSNGLTRFLAPRFAGDNERLTVFLEQAIPRDSEMTLRRWQASLSAGAVTINEWRRTILNLPAIDGGDELIDAGSIASGGGGGFGASVPAEVKALAAKINPYTNRRYDDVQ